MDKRDRLAEFRARVAQLHAGGGEAAAQKQAASGKLLARDRILTLLDEGSFHEYDLFVEHKCRDFGMAEKKLAGDGVITGTGHDRGLPGLHLRAGLHGGRRLAGPPPRAQDHQDHGPRDEPGVPLIGINDSGGARIQEGVNSLAGYGEIFYRNSMASG
jgi:acetyl-CoA carboxylase carboxyltransferase component